MIYDVVVKCKENEEGSIALYLQDIGLGRIKLRNGSIEAEYITSHRMCDDCMKNSCEQPLYDKIRNSTHSKSIDEIKMYESTKSKVVSAIVKIDPRYHILNRKVKNIIKDARSGLE